MKQSQLDRIEAAIGRVEEKLDVLLKALADETDEFESPDEVMLTLDGEVLLGGPRNSLEPL